MIEDRGKVLYYEDNFNYYSRIISRYIFFIIMSTLFLLVILLVLLEQSTQDFYQRLMFLLLIITAAVFGSYILYVDLFPLTRFVIYENGIIPPKQRNEDFWDREKLCGSY